jgi:pimeloyl-ACP methyl ester carboxylesterase
MVSDALRPRIDRTGRADYRGRMATLTTPAGRFTADAAGPGDGPLVLLLHGYPQTRHTWRAQVPALAAAGYRAVAPDQRGYSAGMRPDPARDLAAYGIDRLVQDVLDLADAAGRTGRPFHLVGHDWGGHATCPCSAIPPPWKPRSPGTGRPEPSPRSRWAR